MDFQKFFSCFLENLCTRRVSQVCLRGLCSSFTATLLLHLSSLRGVGQPVLVPYAAFLSFLR